MKFQGNVKCRRQSSSLYVFKFNKKSIFNTLFFKTVRFVLQILSIFTVILFKNSNFDVFEKQP